MPKPSGATKLGVAKHWLRRHADGRLIEVPRLARELGIPAATVGAALRELAANRAIQVEKLLGGRNTRWRITLPPSAGALIPVEDGVISEAQARYNIEIQQRRLARLEEALPVARTDAARRRVERQIAETRRYIAGCQRDLDAALAGAAGCGSSGIAAHDAERTDREPQSSPTPLK